MKEKSKFPPGWDEARVERVLDHYEGQSGEEAVATAMEVPVELVPAVRELIAKRNEAPSSAMQRTGSAAADRPGARPLRQ